MQHGNCSKLQNTCGARDIALAAILSHNSLAVCFTEKKNRQHFHYPTAYYYSRESKSRWYATAIRIDYVAHLYMPPIVECRRLKCLVT